MGHLVVSWDIFDYHMDGEEWVSEDTAGIYYKVPGCKMLWNILWCTEQPLQQRITELKMTVLLMLRNSGLEDKHLVGIKKNFLFIFHNLPPTPFSLLFLPPWRRERLPTPALWSGEFHGLYSPWGCKESDMTEQLSVTFFTHKREGADNLIYWLLVPSSSSFWDLTVEIYPWILQDILFKKIIYLFIICFLAELGLRWCEGFFFSCGKWGLLSRRRAQAPCGGLSWCRAGVQGVQGAPLSASRAWAQSARFTASRAQAQ